MCALLGVFKVCMSVGIQLLECNIIFLLLLLCKNVSPKSPRYGVSPCYDVNSCFGVVNLCYGVNSGYGVNSCYVVNLCYGVSPCYGVN